MGDLLFSGALRHLDNLHFDPHTRHIGTDETRGKLAMTFEYMLTVFKESKLDEILDHYTEIIPEDDESYWAEKAPPLPNC